MKNKVEKFILGVSTHLMTQDYQNSVRAWVRENLKRLGWSQAELSRRLKKKDASYINHSMRGARDFKAHEVSDMEKLFEQKFDEHTSLHFGLEKESKSVRTVSLGEIITSGFREGDAMGLGAQPVEIPALNLPGYADIEQEVWRVDGDCADLYVQSGNYVIAVPYAAARKQPRIGDKVVVKRYHPVRFQRGDLSYYENSIRMIGGDGAGGFILKSLSSNPDIRDVPYDPADNSMLIHRLIIGGQFHENY